MPKKTTKKYLSVGIAALITAIVIGILIAVWRYKPSLPENIAKKQTESPSAMPTESSGPIVTVTQDNELPSSLIRFSETQGFIPEKLTLAQDAKGKPVYVTAKGLSARILQHEIDHLEGKLIINRVSPIARLKLRKQLKAIAKTGSYGHKPPATPQSSS